MPSDLREAQVAKLREKFEAHFGNDAERLERNADGEYVHPAIHFCWVDGWIACAKHLEKAVKDAARYRQLRRGQKFSIVNGIGDVLRAEELDTAVDAAMAATKGENDAE
jgi:poly-D-alanine transfer protein DltD